MQTPNITNSAKNRMAWIDIAKGFAIILVVYRHILIGIERSGILVGDYYILANISHSFRMPLFFILSGIFIRTSLLKKKNESFILSKLNSLIYPYVVWTVVQISIQWCFRDYINANRTYIDYLYIIINPRAIDQFWFIYALFNVALTYLLFFRLFKGNKPALLLIGCILHYTSQFIHLPVLEDILFFFVYVAIGDIISSYMLNKSNYKFFASPKSILLIALLFVASQWFYIQYESSDLFILSVTALTGCAFTFCISFALCDSKYLVPIKIAGHHSMYIYLMHVLISAPIRIVLVRLLHIEEPGILVVSCTLSAIILPILFYKIALRNGFWLLFTLKRPEVTTNKSPSLLKYS